MSDPEATKPAHLLRFIRMAQPHSKNRENRRHSTCGFLFAILGMVADSLLNVVDGPVSCRAAFVGSLKCLLHDLIRLDEFLIVADVLSGVLDFGQQEVVDDLYDHRGAHLGECEVARCQQCLVIDGIKGVVG